MNKFDELGDLKPEWSPTKEISREQIKEVARLLVDASKILNRSRSHMTYHVLNKDDPEGVFTAIERSCFSQDSLSLVCGNKELGYKLWLESIHYNEGTALEEIWKDSEDAEKRDFKDDGKGVIIEDAIDDYIVHDKKHRECKCYRCYGDTRRKWEEEHNANKG